MWTDSDATCSRVLRLSSNCAKRIQTLVYFYHTTIHRIGCTEHRKLDKTKKKKKSKAPFYRRQKQACGPYQRLILIISRPFQRPHWRHLAVEVIRPVILRWDTEQHAFWRLSGLPLHDDISMGGSTGAGVFFNDWGNMRLLGVLEDTNFHRLELWLRLSGLPVACHSPGW